VDAALDLVHLLYSGVLVLKYLVVVVFAGLEVGSIYLVFGNIISFGRVAMKVIVDIGVSSAFV
jgi:hypothetical protein